MKIRFTIGRRIGISFGVLILLTLIAFVFTLRTIQQSKDTNEDINDVYAPTVNALDRLNFMLNDSKSLITIWATTQLSNEIDEKRRLRKMVGEEYPRLKREITTLSAKWPAESQEKLKDILKSIDRLFEQYEEIMNNLNSFDSYKEKSDFKFLASASVSEDDGDILQQFKAIQHQLSEFISTQHKISIEKTDEMATSFRQLNIISRVLGILLVVGGLVIAIFTVRSIVKPVQQLKKMLTSMGIGVLPKQRIAQRNDEIGEMSDALNSLIDGMERTTHFANELGSGNFFSEYKPLSEDDTLGLALLKMREDLHTNEQILESKVIERTEEVVRQKEEITKKNQELEVLYKHVTDSIRYAKRLQDAILPPANYINAILPNSFVLFKPKDIVSGDFYWVSQKNNKTIFSAIDCTGHGVPGAFMSIVGHNLLKHVLTNTPEDTPASILDELNKGVNEALHQGIDETSTKDGMDISMCSIDFKTLELQFAGAFNPLYLVRNGTMQQIKADKFPIGFFVDKEKKKFTNHKIQLQKGDCVYIFSDGYADQFGGPNGKKFMVNHFNELLLKVHQHPIQEQKAILDKTIESWKGSLEQVDDILVIGVRID